jgi:hypothetical protein
MPTGQLYLIYKYNVDSKDNGINAVAGSRLRDGKFVIVRVLPHVPE